MELNKTKRWIYIGSIVSVAFILLLGSWWLYLVFKLATKLSELNIPQIKGNLVYMIQWEGIAFISLLFIITATHLYMFFNDQKKSRAISAFFASMGHELKTPLASIRLQSQVITDLINKSDVSKKVENYLSRLNEDTARLEHQLEKSLQLSRLEIGGFLNPVNVDITKIIEQVNSDYSFELNIQSDSDSYVIADEQALFSIIKNLFENTKKHSQSDNKTINIVISKESKYLTLIYSDSGLFEGNIKKIGRLFYKHNSPSGSGVGIYLIKKLILKMGGSFKVSNQNGHLTFSFSFLKGEIE